MITMSKDPLWLEAADPATDPYGAARQDPDTGHVTITLLLDAPDPAPGPDLVLPPCGLLLLLEAYGCARELRADPWEFAVEMAPLQAAGLTRTQLRWLLAKGYARQRLERTQPPAPRRTFEEVGNLSLPEGACLVLTEAGAAYALGRVGPAAGGGQPAGPVWDEGRRELRVGAAVVKRFRQRAGNQELVLAAFQEEGWPPRIDDPLPPEAGQDPKRRLRSTISNLNRGQRPGLRVHFTGGGDGESVCWALRSWGAGSRHRTIVRDFAVSAGLSRAE